MVLTQKITRVYKDSLTLKYSQILIFNWNYNFDTHRYRFVDTIIDVDY